MASWNVKGSHAVMNYKDLSQTMQLYGILSLFLLVLQPTVLLYFLSDMSLTPIIKMSAAKTKTKQQTRINIDFTFIS